MQPRILIVIPCYNQAGLLGEAIESALAQTLRADEIIVVDDGSTDRTKQVASRYPVRLISQKNLGVAAARNSAIRCSSAELILPLDSDDKIHPEYLARTTQVLENSKEVDIVFTHRRHFGALDTIKESAEFSQVQMIKKCSVNYCSLYRRRVWELSRGYDEEMRSGYEDWDFWLSAIEHGCNFKLYPEVLFFYRKQASSLSDVARSKHRHLMARLAKRHPSLFLNMV